MSEPTEGLDAFENPLAVGDFVVYFTTSRHTGMVLGRIESFTAAGNPRIEDVATSRHKNAAYSIRARRKGFTAVPRQQVAKYGVPS